MSHNLGDSSFENALTYLLGSLGSLSFFILFTDTLYLPFERMISGTVPSNLFLISTVILVVLIIVLNRFVDYLHNSGVRYALYVISALFLTIGYLAFFLFPANHLFLYATCVFLPTGLVVGAIPWCTFLSTLNHRLLVLFSSVCVLFAGLIICFSSAFSFIYSIAFLIILAIVSFVCSFLLEPYLFGTYHYVLRSESYERNPDSDFFKRNVPALFLTGASWGVSLGLYSWLESFTSSSFILGCAIITASIILYFFRHYQEYKLEEFLLRFGTFLVCCGLVCIPFVIGTPFLPACLFYFTIISTMHLLTAFNAIEETARFNELSPIWLLSKQGSISILSFALFSILFSSILPSVFPKEIILILCQISMLSFVFISSIIKNAEYPNQDAAEESSSMKTITIVESLDKPNKASWRVLLDEVSHEFNLTPRQSEVMELLAKGRDSRYIEESFVVSRATAKTHISNLYKKLGVHSKRELIDYLEEKRKNSHYI